MEPLTEAPALTGPSEPHGSATGAGTLSPDTYGSRILVAEDNPVNATVAVKMLEKRGHRVDLARDGLQAVEMLAAETYDAVLMDCQMPELDGYEATAEIRRGEGPDRRIPIIAMTAHAMAGDREKCIAAGMDDYMSKPIRSDTLHEVLVKWVQPRQDAGPGVPSESTAETLLEQDVPLVDDAIVEDLRVAGTEALEAIAGLYRREADSLVPVIVAGVATGDGPGVAENAHLLKGGSASVGAARMAALAGRIESLARAGTLAEATAWVEALVSCHGPSTAALREAVGSPAAGLASGPSLA